MNPRVSVMLPTQNSLDYLKDSLPAVLKQTYRDFEVLVLDGGSTDGTLEYCHSLDDPRVRVIENAGGLVAARNRGIAEANGEFIAVVDSDTVPVEDRFQRQIEYLSEHPQCAAVGGQVRRINPDGSTWQDEKPRTHDEIMQGLVWANQMVHPSMMMRRAAVESVGGYRDWQWEDYDLTTRLGAQYQLANLPTILLDYYIREEGVVESASTIRAGLGSLRCGLQAIRVRDLGRTDVLTLAVKRTIRSGAQIGYNVLRGP